MFSRQLTKNREWHFVATVSISCLWKRETKLRQNFNPLLYSSSRFLLQTLKMSNDWKQGTFNCCHDGEMCKSSKKNRNLFFSKCETDRVPLFPGLCGSCCTPCLIYRNAEDLGKSGLLCCLLSCVFPCIPLFLLRSEARERYGIEVSPIFLVCYHLCLARFFLTILIVRKFGFWSGTDYWL